MLSFRLKDRWNSQSTLPEHTVISSLFSVVIQNQRQMDPPVQHCQSTEWSLHCSMLSFRLKGRWTPYVQSTVRAQSDLFTVQCCHWESKADGPPWSTLSEHRLISSLFNVVIQTQRQMDTPVNTVRPQSDLFTVQCCHSDSKADGPSSQHCQSTEWSLHCSMLSFRLKGRWTPQSTLSEHSYLFTVQCCHWDSKADGPPFNTVRAQSDLFTVQCCHWDWKTDGPPKKLSEHRVISSLLNVVIQTQR